MIFFSKRNKKILDGIITNKTISHAYIFTGKPGSMVNQAVHYFTKSLQCESFSQGPCEICKACSQSNKQQPDKFIIVPKDSISIEEIRSLQDYIKYGPFYLKYMVVIIHQAHLLTDKAANAFLKTLEEPPQGVIFILNTNNTSQIIPTIRSRCQILEFPVISDQVMQTYIASLSDNNRKNLQTQSANNVEIMKYIIDSDETLPQTIPIEFHQIYQPYSEFIQKSPLEKLNYASKISEKKEITRLVLLLWMKELYDEKNKNKKNKFILEKLVENISLLKYNLNLKLHLENLFLQCQI